MRGCFHGTCTYTPELISYPKPWITLGVNLSCLPSSIALRQHYLQGKQKGAQDLEVIWLVRSFERVLQNIDLLQAHSQIADDMHKTLTRLV